MSVMKLVAASWGKIVFLLRMTIGKHLLRLGFYMLFKLSAREQALGQAAHEITVVSGLAEPAETNGANPVGRMVPDFQPSGLIGKRAVVRAYWLKLLEDAQFFEERSRFLIIGRADDHIWMIGEIHS